MTGTWDKRSRLWIKMSFIPVGEKEGRVVGGGSLQGQVEGASGLRAPGSGAGEAVPLRYLCVGRTKVG